MYGNKLLSLDCWFSEISHSNSANFTEGSTVLWPLLLHKWVHFLDPAWVWKTAMPMRLLLKPENSIKACDLMRVLRFGGEIFQAYATPFWHRNVSLSWIWPWMSLKPKIASFPQTTFILIEEILYVFSNKLQLESTVH